MRRSRWTKVGIAACIALLAVIVCSVGVLASDYTLNKQGRLTVVAADPAYGIGIYSDAACTFPVSIVNWGDVGQGGQSTQTVYIRHEGTDPLQVTVAASGLGANGTLTGDTLILDNPGETGAFAVTVNVNGDALLGLKVFTLVFTVTGAP